MKKAPKDRHKPTPFWNQTCHQNTHLLPFPKPHVGGNDATYNCWFASPSFMGTCYDGVVGEVVTKPTFHSPISPDDVRVRDQWINQSLDTPLREVAKARQNMQRKDDRKVAKKRKLLRKSKKWEGVEDIPIKENASRSQKIRVFPDEKTREEIIRALRVVRWVYNKCVEEARAFFKRRKEARDAKASKDRDGDDDNNKRNKYTQKEENPHKRKRVSEKTEDEMNLLQILRHKWIRKSYKVPGQPKQQNPNCMLHPEMFDLHNAIRDAAANDVVRAYKSNFKKCKKDPSHTFDLKFRSKKKCRQQTLVVPSREWGEKGPLFWRPSSYRKDPNIPTEITHEGKLTRDCLGRYFLHFSLPMPKTPKEKMRPKPPADTHNKAPSTKICALDPGVRTFMTSYDQHGCSISFGEGHWTTTKEMRNKKTGKVNTKEIERGATSRIARLQHRTDKLWAMLNDPDPNPWLKHQTRRNIRRRILKLHAKVSDLVKQMHRDVANFLCSTYDVILIPKFETQELVRKLRHETKYTDQYGHERTYTHKRRRLNQKTARTLCALSHYSFRQTLIHKARFYENTHVLVVDESYTSKTCGRCGWVHEMLGGNKRYKCRVCGLQALRDHNGARNILLRFLATGSPMLAADD